MPRYKLSSEERAAEKERKDWGQIHSQLEIFFADRLPQ